MRLVCGRRCRRVRRDGGARVRPAQRATGGHLARETEN